MLLIVTICLIIAGVSLAANTTARAAGSSLSEMPATTGLSALNLPNGKLSYPVPSPSNPDIIAYTRKDGNRHYLHLYHVTTETDERIVHQTRREQEIQGRLRSVPRNLAEALMRNAGLPTGYFEGDFVWRPGLDQFGYQWFAFVATQAGKTQLHLGYIASGESLRTVVFPIAFGNVVTNPAFSPDGNKLVFSVDGQLYIEQDIGRVIRNREFKLMQPRRITGHANGSFFPSWSADGAMIAYQARPDEGRRTGFETIFVVDVSDLPEGRLPRAHRVSIVDEEDAVSHHQRPSWAPTGRILAWYEHIEQTEQDTGEDNAAQTIRDGNDNDTPEEHHQAKNIRLVRVDFDRSRNAWIGMSLQRPARRFFAESVYAFERSAPRWTIIEYDRRPAEGILWVRYAPDLDHPLHFSHLNYYADNRADFTFNMFSFSNRFEWLERTRNNRYPAAIQSAGHVRYVYVAEVDDRQQLKVVDRQTTAIQPLIRMERREVPAVIRSGIYPGWGHFHIDENRRAAWLTGTFTALAGATVTGAVIRYRTDDSQNPSDALLISLGAATGIAWTFSLIDLSRQFPSYKEIPVTSTFEGYRSDVTHVHDHEYLTVKGPVKRDAMLLSALYPGLGQIYIGERRKGYILGLTFTALAGSTVAGAAYRYHYDGPTPSNEVLIGLGAATLGTWIFNMIDVQQSFRNNYFASAAGGDGAGNTSQTLAGRTEISLVPRVDYLRIGNYAYREYAAIGLSLSF